MTKLIGAGRGYIVGTELEFVQAIRAALAEDDDLAIIHVKLAANDFSPALLRLTGTLAKRV